jgi:hypothetical protein
MRGGAAFETARRLNFAHSCFDAAAITGCGLPHRRWPSDAFTSVNGRWQTPTIATPKPSPEDRVDLTQDAQRRTRAPERRLGWPFGYRHHMNSQGNSVYVVVPFRIEAFER